MVVPTHNAMLLHKPCGVDIVLRDGLESGVMKNVTWQGITLIDWHSVRLPSPDSITIPVVRPDAYRDKTAWPATYIGVTLRVLIMIWV